VGRSERDKCSFTKFGVLLHGTNGRVGDNLTRDAFDSLQEEAVGLPVILVWPSLRGREGNWLHLDSRTPGPLLSVLWKPTLQAVAIRLKAIVA
jgi:hypothetical protein